MKITQIFFSLMISANTIIFTAQLGIGYPHIQQLELESLIKRQCINLRAIKCIEVQQDIQNACNLLEKDLMMTAFTGEIDNALTDDELKTAIETILLHDKYITQIFVDFHASHQEIQNFKSLQKKLQERYNERAILDPRIVIAKK